MKAILVVWRALRQLDNRDVHVYGGLVLSAIGGCVVSVPWTCVAVGCVLMAFGLFGALLDRSVARMTTEEPE